MKNLIFITIMMLATNAFSQINISPSTTEIDMSNRQSVSLSISNTSGSSQAVNLTLGIGFYFGINRCPSLLANNKVCNIMISVSPSLLPNGTTIVSLNNGLSSLTNLKYIKSTASQISSILTNPSSLSFGVLSRTGNSVPQTITITNTGNVTLSPIFTLSPKVSLVINRCSSLQAGKICQISVSVSPTSDMTNSSITGQYVLIKKDFMDIGQSVSVSASLNILLACSGLEHQDNGLCVSNFRSCSISNGTGRETWSFGSWSSCLPISCDVNFNISGNLCILSTASSLSISAGEGNSCLIASNNKPYCSGDNGNGQLGNGLTSRSLVPVAVDMSGALSGKTVKSISVGGAHACAIASDDKPYCWGYNGSGQLGDGSQDRSLVPVAVNMSGALSGKTVKSIHSGPNFTCVIASDDKPYCWGYNSDYQLGTGNNTDSLVPVAVNMSGALSGKTVKSIALGNNHSCVIASDDKPYCWGGHDSTGELGTGVPGALSSSPVAVNMSGLLSGKTVKFISLGYFNTCVIASDDKPYCWGLNTYGQLGDGAPIDRSSVPVAVDMSGSLSGKTVKFISSGSWHSCVIASDNKPYCWGKGGNGILGNQSGTNSSTPVSVDMNNALSGKTVKYLSVGNSQTCVIGSDDKSYCWGWNFLGGLGDGTRSNAYDPVLVQMYY